LLFGSNEFVSLQQKKPRSLLEARLEV